MIDITFTNFLLGYLGTDESHAAGVPLEHVCAMLAMDGDTQDRDPRICVLAEVQGENRALQIHLMAVARSTGARNVTDPWLDAVGRRLEDRAAFLAHIAAQPVEKRMGYQIEQISRPGPVKVKRSEEGPIETGVGVIIYVTV